MNANLSALLYLAAGILFILSLRGLSSPATSRQGNRYGMIGMAIAIVTTLALQPPAGLGAWALVILGIAIGGGIGAWRARTVQMTAMPQLVASFHALVGLAAVLVATLAPGRGARRYMAAGQLVMLPEVLRIFRQSTGRRLPSMPTPASVYRVLGRLIDAVRRVIPFNTVFTAEAMELLTQPKDSDDSAVVKELDVRYRDVAGTIADGLRGLYEAGHLSPKQAGVLAR